MKAPQQKNDINTPFVQFDVEVKPKEVMSCVGFVSICANPQCDCGSVHINIYEKGKPQAIACVLYGWRDSSYYIGRGEKAKNVEELTRGVLIDKPETEQSRAVLRGFREWLSRDKITKDQIFADQYNKFKSNCSNKGALKARELKLKKCLNLMLELFEVNKVEKFMAECGEPIRLVIK